MGRQHYKIESVAFGPSLMRWDSNPQSLSHADGQAASVNSLTRGYDPPRIPIPPLVATNSNKAPRAGLEPTTFTLRGDLKATL